MSENSTENKKYKVLLFGTRVLGSISFLNVDYCDVTLCHYPTKGQFEKINRLSEYDIIILDYAAFDEKDTYNFQIFDKRITQAVDSGKTVCFLHYNESIPLYEYDVHVEKFLNWQIGLRRAIAVGIPKEDKYVSHSLQIKRQEFKTFGEHWGTSRTIFEPLDNPVEYEEIFLFNNSLSGFAYQSGKGKIIFLPCQRHYSKMEDIKECLTVLVNSILNYLKNTETSIPDWATSPLFEGESKIYDELQETRAKISELENSLEPYQAAKSLSFLREYNFENAVPKFIESSIGLPILRNDISKEDFWILDSDGNKQIICETKTYLRGFKKTGIYNLYTHRESNNLEDDFPALLIVNQHTIANSWKEKIQPIPPQDYQLAVTNNVLVMRVEDLLFFWNLIVKGEKTKEDLLSYLKKNGWLEVTKEVTITLHT